MTEQSLLREILSIFVIGLFLAVVMVDSIVGMSSGFAPNDAGLVLAGSVDHE